MWATRRALLVAMVVCVLLPWAIDADEPLEYQLARINAEDFLPIRSINF
jgi:hypothetical protein